MGKCFEKASLKAYFHLQEQKKHGFVDICQGGMIVNEYTSKFHNLKCFCSDIL